MAVKENQECTHVNDCDAIAKINAMHEYLLGGEYNKGHSVEERLSSLEQFKKWATTKVFFLIGVVTVSSAALGALFQKLLT